MKDINNIEIKLGMMVKTTQPSGGLFNPGPSVVGEVVYRKLSYSNTHELAIKFKNNNDEFHSYILLDGKINEII